MHHSEELEQLVATLKRAVQALREQEVPFVLGGSVAAWARGGPEPTNDIDLMVKPEHADTALAVLTEAGMRPERPPEEWLLKAWHGSVLIDVIFEPSGLEITDEVIERADTIPVMSVATPVMALEDVLVTMLCALDEHTLDYSRLVAIARALREQIDWPRLRGRTGGSLYAEAFFTLVESIGIAPTRGQPSRGAHRRVRVLDGGARSA
jgi:predicted nucleotidyltransferase